MDHNRIEGTANKVAGRAEEAVGALTGDAKTQADGVARQTAGASQDAYGHIRDQVRDTVAVVNGSVQQQPLVALLVAGALGCVLGLLLAKR